MQINRNRTLYFILIIATIGIGLSTRSKYIPEIIYPYLGDILYALMIYLTIGFFFPRMNSKNVAFISIIICFSIEISQLYQAEWIIEIRRTKLGGLILGFGFLWYDLISYLIGGMIGVGLENLLKKKFQSE